MPDRTDDIDPGLATRLSDYVSALPAADPPEPGLDPRGSRRRWVLALTTGTAAVAAGAVLGFVLLDGPRSDVADASPTPSMAPVPSVSAEPSPTPTPSPTVAPTPTATAEPTATPAPSIPDRWTLARVVPIPDNSSPGPNMRGVVWHPGPGFIAHGSQTNEPGGLPGIWTSADGASWQPATLPGNLAGYSVNDVAWTADGPTRFVAVADRFEPSPQATVLVSNDGITWIEATTPDNATYLQSVTHGPEGFIAVGYESDLTSFESDGRVWLSADGLSWAETDPASLDRTALLGVEIVGGAYVAVGYPDGEAPPMQAWRSADGQSWTGAEVTATSTTGCICLATGSNTSAMVIASRLDATFAASTADGTAWNVVPIDGADFGTSADDVEVLDDGAVVIVGHLDIADGPRGTLIWVRDAETAAWRTVDWQEHLPDVDPAQVDVGRAVYVAVAQDQTVILVADGTVLVTSDRIP